MVITSAGGSPDRSLARAGDAHGDIVLAGAPRYWDPIFIARSIDRIGPCEKALRESVPARKSVGGGTRTCARKDGPPSPRSLSAATAARFAPALSPPTAIRSGSPPNSPIWSAAQRSGGAVDGRGERIPRSKPVIRRYDQSTGAARQRGARFVE